MSFVHLRTHTEYSVVDGTLRIDDAAAMAAGDAQVALGITDLDNLFGALKFYSACRKKGIKPIIGADIWLEPLPKQKAPSRLALLVQNPKGYHNLCEILGRAWTRNVHGSQAWIKWDWLAELGEGLIALSGADLGVVGQALLAGDSARATTAAQKLASLFPGRFYLELQRAGLPTNEQHVQAAVALAFQMSLPVVATHPVQFARPEDFEAHEARVCIAQGETIANPKRERVFNREQYFKTQEQMCELFADLPAAVANTLTIAQRCSLGLVLGKPRLPNFPTPIQADGNPMPIDQYFRQLSFEGLEDRLQLLYPDTRQRDEQRPRYVQRLEFEIGVILTMGFPGYFLIVADFINWAKNNGCPVGPGRGSGAGSLVAYALKITDLDPLQYNLLFERFLNPDRVSMPDFDVDFCQSNRDRVIDYVKDKYGREAVSQIATFGTMAAKASLRDIGRVMGMGYGQVDAIAKLIPAPPGKSVTLAPVPENPDGGVIYARKEAPEIEQRAKNDEEIAGLLSLATRVEGMVRNIGMHAGGVLIAPGKITDFCPLYQQPGSDSAVSQYDKDDVEAIGLVKFDFLGLATLTILENAREFISTRHPDQRDFAFEKLPLDDAAVYKLFSDGLTEAVFQFESRGMQGMLRDAKPSRLEDLIALNALYRPGPMDLIPTFVARKHGREPVLYPHEMVEGVLSETYGIMVYQEQVMQVAQVLGGYTLGGADLLRRAMGKKKAEEMAKHREIFRAGAAKNGISQEKADEVFDLMEKFAGYGFNKSHAAAYSLLAYHTAWVKVHYTAEFYAANMTVELDNTDKLKVLIEDAKRFDIDFEAPNVNLGVWRFEPISDLKIRYGLGAVKGTGRLAIDAIVAARNSGGPFLSLFDFSARVDRRRVNKRVVEALIKAGAFDSLHTDRAGTLASVALAFEWAEAQAQNQRQDGLFDFGDSHGSSRTEPALVKVAAWGSGERLGHEKVALGFYLTGHLFDQYETEIRKFVRTSVAALKPSKEPVVVAGIVSELKIFDGQRGLTAVFKLDDKTGHIEVSLGEDLVKQHRSVLVEDQLIVLQGRLTPDRFSGGVRMNAQQVWSIAQARCEFARHVRVTIREEQPPIKQLLSKFPAKPVSGRERGLVDGLPVRLAIHRSGGSADVDLGPKSLFFPSQEALQAWRDNAAEPEVIY